MKPRKHGPNPPDEAPGDKDAAGAVSGQEAGDRAGASSTDSALEELARLQAREDELLRALAESQNVLRRRKQEMDSNLRHAEEAVVRELLPVLDDLERALAAMSETADPSIRTGVSLVRDRLVGVLEQRGLRAIRPQGEPFDPELMDALAQRPALGAPPGSVLEVIQPGYRFRERVLRHAKVIVAATPEPETSGTESATRRSE